MKKNSTTYALLLLSMAFFSCVKSSEKPNKDHNIKGCGDFSIYKIISDDMILSIRIDHTKIAFSKEFQTIETIASSNVANVEIQQNCDIDNLFSNKCNDVFVNLSCATTRWKMQNGTLSFKVNKVLPSYNCGESYLATVILNNAVFRKDSSSETQTMERVEIKNVRVGWCAG